MKNKGMTASILVGVLGLAAVFNSVVNRYDPTPSPPEIGVRAETVMHPDDISLARTMFGRDIDYYRVELHKHLEVGAASTDPDAPGPVRGTASAHEIHIWGSDYIAENYSNDPDPEKYGLFVQQLTGVWQHNTNFEHTRTDGQYSGSRYAVGDEFVFSDYGPEQQRAMMQDYALRFLHPTAATKWLAESYGPDTAATDSHLSRTVEEQFPGLETQRRQVAWAAQHSTTPSNTPPPTPPSGR